MATFIQDDSRTKNYHYQEDHNMSEQQMRPTPRFMLLKGITNEELDFCLQKAKERPEIMFTLDRHIPAKRYRHIVSRFPKGSYLHFDGILVPGGIGIPELAKILPALNEGVRISWDGGPTYWGIKQLKMKSTTSFESRPDRTRCEYCTGRPTDTAAPEAPTKRPRSDTGAPVDPTKRSRPDGASTGPHGVFAATGGSPGDADMTNGPGC